MGIFFKVFGFGFWFLVFGFGLRDRYSQPQKVNDKMDTEKPENVLRNVFENWSLKITQN
jgi:hypothetical protein